MSLNVNAKAFVPPGGGGGGLDGSIGIPGVPNAYSFFRYVVALPTSKHCEPTEPPATSMSALQLLLLRRQVLSSGKGGTAKEAQLEFAEEFFSTLLNEPVFDPMPRKHNGFVLSRTIMSVSGSVEALGQLNDASGFLIPLNVPSHRGADVRLQLKDMWEIFFGVFGHDFRLTCMGYLYCHTGAVEREAGTFRHYFFVSCTPQKSQLQPFTARLLEESSLNFRRVIPVKSILPYIINLIHPIGLVVALGEEASAGLEKDGPLGASYTIEVYPDDAKKTMASLSAVDQALLSILEKGEWSWARTHLVSVCLKLAGGPARVPQLFSISDVLWMLKLLCDDVGSAINVITFSENCGFFANGCSPRTLPFSNVVECNACAGLLTKPQNYADFDGVLSTCGLPTFISHSLSRMKYEAACELIATYSPATRPVQLVRSVFAKAVDEFATGQYVARRSPVGTPVLVGKTRFNSTFIVNLRCGAVGGVPPCWSYNEGVPKDSLFEGVLVSSFRSQREYRIIITDVIVFNGTAVAAEPFEQRRGYLESMALDDEDSWPHCHTEHLVILQATHVDSKQAEFLIKSPQIEHPVLGVTFVPNAPRVVSDSEPTTYVWIHPESITVNFIAGKIETIVDNGSHSVRRIWLYSPAEPCGEPKPYLGEYADVPKTAHQSLEAGDTIECMLRRTDDGAHWWEVLRQFRARDMKSPSLCPEVEHFVHSPGITYDEMVWLVKSSQYTCGRCNKISDLGRVNPKTDMYLCRSCWEGSGYGDCVYCGRAYLLGFLDGVSNRFYCEACWDVFSSCNNTADVGYNVPPPPAASFGKQVSTRCISLLIDIINPKAPTNDVLDMCCGGTVIRKWMKNQTTRYVGFDLKASVVDSLFETISSLERETPANSRYDVICADTFSDDFWTHHIIRIHPRQFQTITCFAGFHHAFVNEAKARHVVASISNALVPGGVFIGCFLDPNYLYHKGRTFSNSIFSHQWQEGSVPRIGNHFKFTLESAAEKEINVVPPDFLVAVASEHDMTIIPECCLTFKELIENDSKWMKVPNAHEKEYLGAMRTFAFRKAFSQRAGSQIPRRDTDSTPIAPPTPASAVAF